TRAGRPGQPAVLALPGQLGVHLLQRLHVCFLDPQDRLVAPEQHHPAVLALYLVDVGIRLPHRALIVSIDHPVGRHVATPFARIAAVQPISPLWLPRPESGAKVRARRGAPALTVTGGLVQQLGHQIGWQAVRLVQVPEVRGGQRPRSASTCRRGTSAPGIRAPSRGGGLPRCSLLSCAPTPAGLCSTGGPGGPPPALVLWGRNRGGAPRRSSRRRT